METIIRNIVEKLKTVQELKYVSEDWGQLKIDLPQVDFPCAVVDFREITYTQQPNKTQLAKATINVCIADRPADSTEGYKTYKIMEEVHKLLHGYETEMHTKLIKTNIKRVERKDTIKEFLIEFTTNFMDATAARVYTPHPTPPGITITL